MRIERVTIDNYRSIKHVEFDLSPGLNAFIGANSTGKSNIFNAINWLLGPVYPSFNSCRREDHFKGDENNKIKIRLDFDDGHALTLDECKSVVGRNGKLEIKSGLFLDEESWNCSGEKREKYCSAYLGVEREILDYLPSNRWSLVGRILQEVNKKFSREEYTHKDGRTQLKSAWLKELLTEARDNLLFSVKDDRGENIMGRFTEILQEECAKQLNRPKEELEIDLSLYDPWNFYKTLQLVVREHDADIQFQASNLGMGVQAAISVAILKAYSELNLANKSPIFIDEPELFLHPQAQRNFHRILRELSNDTVLDDGSVREGTQVFYTTHSPNFLSAGNFDEIFLVRKNAEDGTHLRFANVGKFIDDLKVRTGIETNYETLMLHYRNAYENTGDTQKANEAFFASKIILVEGQSEALVLPLYFESIGFDYVQQGISIVRCGGKSEIDRFYRLYTEFGIPVFVIFDGDKQLAGTKEESENLRRNASIFSVLGIDPAPEYPDGMVHGNYLGFETEFGERVGITTSEKGLDLYIKVKDCLRDGTCEVPEWAPKVVTRLGALDSTNVGSVLKAPV